MPPNTPPPLPRPPLPVYADPAKGTFLAQAARASWIATVIALVLGCLTMPQQRGDGQPIDSGRMVVAWVNAGLISLGFLLALFALIGAVVKRSYKYVLVPAIVGLLLNGVLIASGIVLLLTARAAAHRRLETARQEQIQQWEKEGEETFRNFDGWFGASVVEGATFTISECHRDSPMTRGFLENFGSECQVLLISIDNRAGKRSWRVDAEKSALVFANGSTAAPMDADSFFATAKKDRDNWIAKFAQPRDLRAGETLSDLIILVPQQFDIRNVAEIKLELGEIDVVIPGEHLTAEQKQEMLRQAQRQQRMPG